MAKKTFLADLDLALNQLLQARLENLAASPAASPGRVYWNTVDHLAYQYDGTTWQALVNTSDARLTNARTPTTHVIATNAALGAEHSISGAPAGSVLRATDATHANFQQLAHTDLSGVGSYTHPNIDTHINDATLHRQINDAAPSGTTTYSGTKIEALVTAVNTTVTGALIFKGSYDAFTNNPLLDATPVVGIKQGWTYVVTVAGTFFAEDLQPGDMVIAKQDSPTTAAHWTTVNKNIPDIIAASTSIQGIIQLATQAEVTTGTDTNKAVTPATLKSDLGVSATGVPYINTAGSLSLPRKFVATVGDGTLLSYAITHNLGTTATLAVISRTATPFDAVECEIIDTSANVTTFNFNAPAPTAAQYTIAIIG